MPASFFVCFALVAFVRASYLHPSRFAFGGAYYTNPGTLNNFVNNWDPSKPIIPWWGPEGLNFFRFENATVTSVAGELDESGSSDCLFGAQVATSTDSKIVDIDPDHQFSSEIYALQLQIVLASGFTIAGQLRVSQLDSVFFKSETGIEHENPLLGNRTSEMTGSWQSLIEGLQWDSAPPSCSPLLNALYATSRNSLSIKFTTDMYDNRIGAATKGYGRLVGVIGPYFKGEPTSFSPRRMMAPLEGQAFKQNSSHIPFVVFNKSTLLLDLGSSIKTKTFGGSSIFDQAILYYQAPNSTLIPFKNGIVNVSDVNNDGKGGIVSLQLTGDEASWIGGHPLLIFSYFNGSKGVLICAEHPQGLVVSTDTRAARLDMDPIAIPVRAFQWGLPVSLSIPITYGESPMPRAPGRVNNVPRDGCLFEPLIQSDRNGRSFFPFAILLTLRALPR